MTLEQFFVELKHTPRHWTLNGDLIRSPFLEMNCYCCPITALRNASALHAPYIARQVGLSKRTAVRIIHAADFADTPHKKLRRRLLNACGLL